MLDLETRARSVLRDTLPAVGLKTLASNLREALQYGLENGLFNQKAVDSAQTAYMRDKARSVLRYALPAVGLKEFTSDSRKVLVYGVVHGIFTHKDIVTAQNQYKATKK